MPVTMKGVGAALARLSNAGYQMPAATDPTKCADEWFDVLDGIGDHQLKAAIDQFLRSSDRWWPQPGAVLDIVRGLGTGTVQWKPPRDSGPPVTDPAEMQEIWLKTLKTTRTHGGRHFTATEIADTMSMLRKRFGIKTPTQPQGE